MVLAPSSKTVSIIIPVFNAGLTIEHCLHSLQIQTYENIEIILVDDASSDDSCDKIQQHIEQDPRIKLFQQVQNNGASASRNIGINKARGTYVFFLDADDWLEVNAIESLVSLAIEKDSDFVCASHIQNFDDHSKKKEDGTPNHDLLFESNDLINYIKNYLNKPYYFTLFVHCWGKLYKLQTIHQHKLEFNQRLSQLEDVNFNFQYLQYCESVSYKNDFLYHHRISQQSQSMSTLSGVEENAIEKILTAFRPIKDFLHNKAKETQINVDKECAHLFITTIIITLIRLCKRFLRKPSINLMTKIAIITKSEDVSKRLHFYTPSPGESKLLLWALKTKIPLVVLFAGLLRACIIVLTK